MKLRLVALALLVVATAWAGPQSRQGGTGDAKAHLDRGNALYSKGNLVAAIAEYREAIRLKPDYAQAHYSLGDLLGGKGDHDAAITEYREAIRLKPDWGAAHLDLGVVLEAKGDRRSRNIARRPNSIRKMRSFAEITNGSRRN